jgi:hypothetical protein
MRKNFKIFHPKFIPFSVNQFTANQSTSARFSGVTKGKRGCDEADTWQLSGTAQNHRSCAHRTAERRTTGI